MSKQIPESTMTPQKFVKQKFPNSKDMYRDEAGHAIIYPDKETGRPITLSYGRTSAKAWKNAMENIKQNIKSETDKP